MGVSLARQLFVPEGMRPIWGIPVVPMDRVHFALKAPGLGFVGHNGTMGMRLERATWAEIPWTGNSYWMTQIPGSYLGLVAAVQSSCGWFELYEQWKNLTPAGLVKWFEQNRKTIPITIETDGVVVYKMSKEGREIRWAPPLEEHEQNGTVTAILPGRWGEIKGSHYFLFQLLDLLGFPTEMLEPIPSES